MLFCTIVEFVTYYIGVSSNGRTEAFEAFNRGSNPCTPAEFVFFASEAINTKKLKFASRMFSEKTQEDENRK